MTSQLNPERNSIEKTIRRKSDYVHFLFANVNFLVMFVASLDFFNNVAICIALTGISSMLYVTFFYYWKIRNPFFIIFNYGSTICTLIIHSDVIFWNFFIIYFVIVSPFQILWIFIVLYFIYLITLIGNFGTISLSRKKFIARYGFHGHYPQKVDQMWQDDSVDTFKHIAHRTTFEEQAKFKNEQKKFYNVRKITLLTLIFTICFLIIYTYALMN